MSFFPLQDAEAVLLVDSDECETREGDIIFDEGAGCRRRSCAFRRFQMRWGAAVFSACFIPLMRVRLCSLIFKNAPGKENVEMARISVGAMRAAGRPFFDGDDGGLESDG